MSRHRSRFVSIQFKKFYSFLAALNLYCCTQALSSCSERGLLFIVVCRLLVVMVSFVVEQVLSVPIVVAAACELSS